MARAELEARLLALGREVEFPVTPDLVAGTTRRLGGRSPRGRRVGRGWRWALAAVLVAAVAAGGLLASSSQARQAVGGFLGLKGIQITKSKQLSTPSPSSGRRQVTLAEAERLASFRVLAPTGYGIDRVWFDDRVPGGEVELVVTGGPSVVEVEGATEPATYQKMLGASGQAVAVTVDGHPGYWVTGPHAFVFRDRQGEFRQEPPRSGPALVFERGGLVVRVEGAADQSQALAIAASL